MFTPLTKRQQILYLGTTIGCAVTGSVLLATGPLTIPVLGVGTLFLLGALVLMINLSIAQALPPHPRYSTIV